MGGLDEMIKFLKDVLIRSINSYTKSESIIKLLKCLPIISIIFTILKAVGLIDWSWEIILFPLFINYMLVGALILAELFSMILGDLEDKINDLFNRE